jgi:hypothetical protein
MAYKIVIIRVSKDVKNLVLSCNTEKVYRVHFNSRNIKYIGLR